MVKATTPGDLRRKRILSEEEDALWQAVAKTAKPLGRRKKAVPAKAILSDDIGPIEALPSVSKRISKIPVAPIKFVHKPAPPLASLTRREKSRIAKGHREIDARIDLHGMTQARAHRALIAFLNHASGDGAGVVLVITGKGRTVGPESERGVLRRQVPLWLGLPELRGLVVGFESAHIGHGGEGALYVRLRRMRG